MSTGFDDITFLQSAYKTCFGIAIAALILAVALFFLLDIREIFMIETGRAQRKTVQEMHEKNLRTGKLRDDKESSREGDDTVKSTKAAKTLEKEKNSRNGPETVEDLSRYSADNAGGHPKRSTESGSGHGAGSWSADSGGATVALSGETALPGSTGFRVVRKTIVTHTDETISA